MKVIRQGRFLGAMALAVFGLAACTAQEVAQVNTVYTDVDGSLKTACALGATGETVAAAVDATIAASDPAKAAAAACAVIDATPTALPLSARAKLAPAPVPANPGPGELAQ